MISLLLCSGGSGGGNAGGTLGGLAVPFLRGGHLRSSMHRSYSVGLTNSPVNGLLYVRGTIGECCLPQRSILDCRKMYQDIDLLRLYCMTPYCEWRPPLTTLLVMDLFHGRLVSCT